MLPVACLPAASLLMGIGYWIDPVGWGANSAIAAFLIKAGGALIDNMAILFAVGVALGMSKNQDGAAGLSGLVAFEIVQSLLAPATVAMLKGIEVGEVSLAFSKINNQFIGIMCGLIAAAIYNRFHNTQLPIALSFFSGKRCVAIITSATMLVVSALLFFVWPFIFSTLVSFGKLLLGFGPIGAGIFGFFNRILIPVGLHHALNSVFWFDVANINDIGVFWGRAVDTAGAIIPPIKGVTGMYQAGFFPVMMFGLPAAALAMYHTAKTEKKKIAAGLLLAAAVSAFFTGVTEPLEFSFMFLAPLLYVVHAVLTGISLFLAATLKSMAGFGFSAGFVDYFLSFKAPGANKPWLLIPLGLLFAVIYYVVFRFLIVKFDLKTPGREDDDIDDGEKQIVLSNDNFAQVAKAIYDALGGKENIISIDNCITRLRLEVKDNTPAVINEKAIKAAGAAGIIRPAKGTIQVIIGTKVQFVADEMKKL